MTTKNYEPINEHTTVCVSSSIYGFKQGQTVSHARILGPFFRVRQKYRKQRDYLWYCVCQCSCGTVFLTHTKNWRTYLKNKCKISCGCFRRENARKLIRKLDNALKFTLWGETKKLDDWLKDPRCLVSKGGIRYRMFVRREGFESALTRPPDPSRVRWLKDRSHEISK